MTTKSHWDTLKLCTYLPCPLNIVIASVPVLPLIDGHCAAGLLVQVKCAVVSNNRKIKVTFIACVSGSVDICQCILSQRDVHPVSEGFSVHQELDAVL